MISTRNFCNGGIVAEENYTFKSLMGAYWREREGGREEDRERERPETTFPAPTRMEWPTI